MRLTISTVLLLALAAPPAMPAQSSGAGQPLVFNARIPLGVSGFFMRPARRTLYLLGTARSPFFAGWRLVGDGASRTLLAADGSHVRYFPRHVQFRVTATALTGTALEVERDFLDVNDDLNHFLLNLGFRLKIFHGLSVTTVEPESIDMIGMPSDVPYEARIYRASFALPPVPIEDRIVLEVLTPEGDRFCKFHLEF